MSQRIWRYYVPFSVEAQLRFSITLAQPDAGLTCSSCLRAPSYYEHQLGTIDYHESCYNDMDINSVHDENNDPKYNQGKAKHTNKPAMQMLDTSEEYHMSLHGWTRSPVHAKL